MSSTNRPAEFGETPPKVIFESAAPGTDTEQLYRANQAAIAHFHGKARQQRLLSDQPGMAMQQALPGGGRMTYAYNNGQETITVKLAPPRPESPGLPHPVEPEKPWETALLEIVVPDMDKTTAVFAAFVASDKNPEFALDASAITTGKLIYATAQRSVLGTDPGVFQVSSLKIDLRGRYGALRVDLYGYIQVYYDDGEPVLVGSTLDVLVGRELLGRLGDPPYSNAPILGAVGGYSILGTPWSTVQQLYPELSGTPQVDPSKVFIQSGNFLITYEYFNPSVRWSTEVFNGGLTPDQIMAQFEPADHYINPTNDPNITKLGYNTWWNDAKTIVKSFVAKGSGYQYANSDDVSIHPGPTVGEPHTASFYTAWYAEYYKPLYNTPQEPQYITRTAQFFSVMFRPGDPLDAVSAVGPRSDDAGTSYRWQTSKMYPARWKLNDDPKGVEMHTQDRPADSSLANHFGMPFLGRATIDVEHGTVKWEPA